MASDPSLNIVTLPVTGMHCAACASFIERNLAKVDGVGSVQVNYGTEKVKLAFDPARAPLTALAEKVAQMGYGLILPRAAAPSGAGAGADPAEEAAAADLAQLTAKVEFSMPLALLVFSVMVWDLAAGLVPGLPKVPAPTALRLRGLYLAITTLAFSFIINTVILEARPLTNGARGISVQRPDILGVSFEGDVAFTYLCLGVAVLTLLATLNLRRSRVGRAFVAIRDNDIAARVMGINLPTYKLLAFVTSSFVTGIAGALYGIYLSFVSVEGFPFLLSIEALAILIVGGLGSALGAILGTVLIVLLPEAARLLFSLFSAQMDAMFSTGAQELKSMLYGAVIILFLRFQPRGLVGAWHDLRRLWVNWPLRY